ncbi:MAG: hypothetical protein OXC96_04695 [Cyanobacteria bacterium MAG CAR1_bin_15]|nr:hypothetical protein [Cyanobacteria bacterium MAG CAR1_bin_15]
MALLSDGPAQCFRDRETGATADSQAGGPIDRNRNSSSRGWPGGHTPWLVCGASASRSPTIRAIQDHRRQQGPPQPLEDMTVLFTGRVPCADHHHGKLSLRR